LIEDILFLLGCALRGILLLANTSVPALLRSRQMGLMRIKPISLVGLVSSLTAQQIHALLCLLGQLDLQQTIQERGLYCLGPMLLL
jgi:hypothetical protein